MTWNAPKPPSGLDTFQAKQQPRPEPVDDLSRFVLNRITFEEGQPHIDGIADLHYKPGGAAAHRYAGYVRRDMVVFRRIVAQYVETASLPYDIGLDVGRKRQAKEAMLALAMRWSAHQDFRAEWALD